MARYTGPKIKISRKFGQKLGLRTNEEAFTRRPYKPGEHGVKSRRGRLSEYGLQLAEKQKAKCIYGVMERQFHRYYLNACKSQNVGLALLQILELRLDTVVFRSGFAITQSQARQFVSHGHICVDGKKVNIPSFAVKPGMVITVSSKEIQKVIESQSSQNSEVPNWLKVNKFKSEVLALPEREEINSIVNEQMIIEYYSR